MNRFLVGDAVPWFQCKSSSNPQFNFHSIGGRYVILSFFGSAVNDIGFNVLSFLCKQIRHKFNDSHLCFFGVSIDPQDLELNRVQDMIPGIRFFWDFDLKVSNLYGALQSNENNIISYAPFTLVLDPSLRVIANIPIIDADSHNRSIEKIINELPSVDDYAQVPISAPILIVPRVFEPEFCRQLIN